MTAVYDFLLHVQQTLPPWLVACLLAWLMSFTVTQPLKFVLPLNWYPSHRESIARVVAFLSAFATVAYRLRDTPDLAIMLGIFMGVWSPLMYWLAIRGFQYRYPKLADYLSADIRGVVAGEIRTSPGKDPRA